MLHSTNVTAIVNILDLAREVLPSLALLSLTLGLVHPGALAERAPRQARTGNLRSAAGATQRAGAATGVIEALERGGSIGATATGASVHDGGPLHGVRGHVVDADACQPFTFRAGCWGILPAEPLSIVRNASPEAGTFSRPPPA